jgi:hypothetical protein
MKPNEKVNVTFDWTPGSGGYSTTLNVTADSDNNVTETDEGNNSKTKSVYVNPDKPPDLIVTLVDVPDDVYVNESNTINATIKNNGSSNITWSFNTTLSVNLVGEDGSIVDYETVSSLNAGATANVSYNWTPTAGGTYRLKVVADSGDVVFESDEANNHLINWSTVKAKKLYDFNTSAGVDRWAYEQGDAGSNKPPGSGPNIAGETLFTSYTLIASLGGDPYDTRITKDRYATHHFKFNITEDSVSKITVLWEGHGDQYTSYVYIWNGTGWADVGNNPATSDSNVSKTFTANCSDYINASTGYLHLLATSTKTVNAPRKLGTNYIKVEVTYPAS